MKTIFEIKEEMALKCHYKATDDKSAWQTLMSEIKSDDELIDFYTDIVAKEYAEEAILASVQLIEKESWAKDIVDPMGFILSRLSDKIENLIEDLK